MHIYLTHCSKEKDVHLKGTDIAVTPDKLYTNPGIQRFMQRCQEKQVNWGVISDLYGVYLFKEYRIWYEKHPDTVTLEEESSIVIDFNDKLKSYNEILFLIRPEPFHPFYGRVLRKTNLADRVRIFRDINCIK